MTIWQCKVGNSNNCLSLSNSFLRKHSVSTGNSLAPMQIQYGRNDVTCPIRSISEPRRRRTTTTSRFLTQRCVRPFIRKGTIGHVVHFVTSVPISGLVLAR